MSKYLAVALIIISLIIGTGIGYALSPQYAMDQAESKNSMDLGKADRNLDLRYLNSMIAHHRSAMLLAEQALHNSSRKEVKELAEDILKAEPIAIDQLYAWKTAWYNDSSKVADLQVANLGAGGENFDLRFLNALIAHHEEGIEMTDEVMLKSSRSEVLDNAAAVKQFLTNGVNMLSEWRTDWYPTK